FGEPRGPGRPHPLDNRCGDQRHDHALKPLPACYDQIADGEQNDDIQMREEHYPDQILSESGQPLRHHAEQVREKEDADRSEVRVHLTQVSASVYGLWYAVKLLMEGNVSGKPKFRKETI